MERYLKNALHRAETRDRKRRPHMKVSGRSVLTLQKLLRQTKKPT
jgi:hypothetical protein